MKRQKFKNKRGNVEDENRSQKKILEIITRNSHQIRHEILNSLDPVNSKLLLIKYHQAYQILHTCDS